MKIIIKDKKEKKNLVRFYSLNKMTLIFVFLDKIILKSFHLSLYLSILKINKKLVLLIF